MPTELFSLGCQPVKENKNSKASKTRVDGKLVTDGHTRLTTR